MFVKGLIAYYTSYVRRLYTHPRIKETDKSTNVYIQYYVCIKTHDSELRGQEEAGRARQTSELFTGSTAVKFVIGLNKLSLKLSLSYQCSNYVYRISNPTMYENGATNPMRVKWRPFVHPRSKNHRHGTHSPV